MNRHAHRHTAPTRPPGMGKDENRLSIIILGANPKYRMRSYGPTPLFKLKSGKTLIQHQVDVLSEYYPNSDIILVTGFESDRVIKHRPNNCRIIENQLYDDTGEFEQIRLGLNNITTDYALILGSVYFTSDNLDGLTKGGPNALIDSNEDSSIGVHIVNNKVQHCSYALNKRKWLEAIFLGKWELDMLRKIVSNVDKNRLFAWEAINQLVDENITIHARYTDGMFVIERSEDKERLSKI
jgi:choline kinase